MSFRRRAFPEILDNLLTSITKGVAAEAHPFPSLDNDGPIHRHILQKAPVKDIVSVYGSLLGNSHLFREGKDYRLSDDKCALEWFEGAEQPDSGTVIHVNYRPESAKACLTDIHTGSVVRTLAESVSVEIASMYAQLEAVYNAGFIDLATGNALDNVVALLGIERIRSSRAVGEIEFTRSPIHGGTIIIPAGTRVMTENGDIEYETTISAIMFKGQNAALVTARAWGVSNPVEANALNMLSVPVAGIAGVTNPSPTAIAVQDETDAELRARAKNLLHGSERATLGAIQSAIIKQGVTADVDELSTPGYVEVTPHASNLDPDSAQRLLTAIEESRPAGVVVRLKQAAPREDEAHSEREAARTLLEDSAKPSGLPPLNGIEFPTKDDDD